MQVPNPLFDLAGIMCGQFGVPFWEFFLATLIGKAIIKTHIQVRNFVTHRFGFNTQMVFNFVSFVLFLNEDDIYHLRL